MQDFLTIHVDDDLFWFFIDGRKIESKKVKFIVSKAVECLKEGAFQ